MKRIISNLLFSAALVACAIAASPAWAQAPTLGTATGFAVLGDQTVTNVGPSVIIGDLGVSPGTSITGFPPGLVIGTSHSADGVALQAQVDATAAYDILANPIVTPCGTNLTGIDLGTASPLTAGVYCFDTSAQLTGALVLDAQGDPDAVFIFQIGSTLTTASGSSATVINSGQNCNVFWQVGSSAILGSGTSLVGNILAMASITLVSGSDVNGRLLALSGSVTLDSNDVTVCALAAVPAVPGDPLLGPPTLSDYDTCDITTGTPAATLLLPYFEIDPSGLGENTLVTITNVSDTSIVAHVTVWSNWSYPVLDFNIFLTGYDVQSMSLRDLLVNGNIPNTARNTATSPRGVRSTRGGTWIEAPYNTGMTPSCDSAQGGNGAIPGFLLPAIQSALTGGPFSIGAINCPQVADESDGYIGYITIDTTHVCSQSLPTDPGYFGAAGEIRHENLLIGDYVRLNDAEGYSGGNPLVHIAAIPGGSPFLGATTLTSSFYQRYQAGFLTTDRRLPLPGLFAARYIEPGTAAGFDTEFVIWREGVTTNAACATISRNAAFPYVEFVRFDERENPTTTSFGCQVSPCLDEEFGLSETQLVNLSSPIFPPDSDSSDPGGWMYMNLQHAEFITRPSQNWVQIRMTGGGRYGVDFDAAFIGNGCQGFVGVTSTADGDVKIGPKYVPGTETLWSGN
ncbi:MAG: ice-binding family protein [Thermoanaerobaculia bacterium]|nr:ice-binding family protein [Thermoanaerobaculia bacterium]